MKYTIYKVTNIVNRNEYVGFTSTTPHIRFIGHLSEAKANTNYKFHNALNKYGRENFVIETLYESNDRDFTLNIMEPYFIKFYNTYRTNHGYNMTQGGDSGPICKGKDNGMYNKKHSVTSLALMSKNRKGLTAGDKNPSKRPEVREKLKLTSAGKNNGMYNKTHSAEAKRKIGIASSLRNKGVPKKKVTCPHCSKIGGAGNMKRYHFEKCKEFS